MKYLITFCCLLVTTLLDAQTYNIWLPQEGCYTIEVQGGEQVTKDSFSPSVFGQAGFYTINLEPERLYIITIMKEGVGYDIGFKTFGLEKSYTYTHYLCWNCENLQYGDELLPLYYLD